jgi:hypothetical protein
MVVLPNIPQMIIAYYATLKIGGVVVMPNPDADARQIVQQVKQTAPKVLITLQEFGRLAAVIQKNTDIDHFIFANIKNVMSGSAHKKLMGRWKAAGAAGLDYTPDFGRSMADLMEDASRKPPTVSVKHSDLAVIIFTSGTTDEPKGVGLSHSNLVANALQTRHWIPDLQYGQEVCLSVVPLMHSYGMSTAMNIPILLGATIVLLPLFELEQVLEHDVVHFTGKGGYRRLIDEADVDAVGIFSPHSVHYEQAKYALEHGKHVLVEKPMICGAGPALQIAELADKKQLVFLIHYQRHYKAKYITARRLIRSGAIGNVESFYIYMAQEWWFPTTWRLMWRDVQVSDAWDYRYKMWVLLMQDFTDK